MAVIEQGHPVLGQGPLDLFLKGRMVGIEEGPAALLDLLLARLLAVEIEGIAVEGGGGAQARGRLAGIERGARGVAVHVDDVAG